MRMSTGAPSSRRPSAKARTEASSPQVEAPEADAVGAAQGGQSRGALDRVSRGDHHLSARREQRPAPPPGRRRWWRRSPPPAAPLAEGCRARSKPYAASPARARGGPAPIVGPFAGQRDPRAPPVDLAGQGRHHRPSPAGAALSRAPLPASVPAPLRAWQRMLSGRRLDLLDPSPLDIEVEDIAHGLARVARWNGQTLGEHAFSVAQHSVLVEEIARRPAAGAGAALAPRRPAARRLRVCDRRHDLAVQGGAGLVVQRLRGAAGTRHRHPLSASRCGRPPRSRRWSSAPTGSARGSRPSAWRASPPPRPTRSSAGRRRGSRSTWRPCRRARRRRAISPATASSPTPLQGGETDAAFATE